MKPIATRAYVRSVINNILDSIDFPVNARIFDSDDTEQDFEQAGIKIYSVLNIQGNEFVQTKKDSFVSSKVYVDSKGQLNFNCTISFEGLDEDEVDAFFESFLLALPLSFDEDLLPFAENEKEVELLKTVGKRCLKNGKEGWTMNAPFKFQVGEIQYGKDSYRPRDNDTPVYVSGVVASIIFSIPLFTMGIRSQEVSVWKR